MPAAQYSMFFDLHPYIPTLLTLVSGTQSERDPTYVMRKTASVETAREHMKRSVIWNPAPCFMRATRRRWLCHARADCEIVTRSGPPSVVRGSPRLGNHAGPGVQWLAAAATRIHVPGLEYSRALPRQLPHIPGTQWAQIRARACATMCPGGANEGHFSGSVRGPG